MTQQENPSNSNIMKVGGVNLRMFGPADNPVFYNKYLKVDTLLCELICKNLNADPFNGNWDDALLPTMIYMLTYGRSLINDSVIVNTVVVYASTMAELIGSMLPESIFLPKSEARSSFVKCVNALKNYTKLEKMSTMSGTNYRYVPEEERVTGWHEGDWDDRESFDAALRVLHHISLKATKDFQMSKLEIMIYTYISVLKKGAVKRNIMETIISGLKEDLGITIQNRLGVITIFSRHYGKYFTDEKIQTISKHFDSLFSLHLRLKIVLSLSGS